MAGAGVGVGAGGVGRALGAEGGKPAELEFSRTGEALQLGLGPRSILKYQLKRPSLGGPAVESGGYVHPLCTPAGVPLTEVAPDDHRHHRGVFCGWVEMHGAADADFWGWGQHAPVKERRIENTLVEAPKPQLGYARFRAVNRWMAGGVKMLTEDVRFGVNLRDGATVVDVSAQYVPEADLTLARWAFGGFAVRGRKDATIRALGPKGAVTLPAPKHTEPESNWPASTWYGLVLTLKDGKVGTLVVAGRASNPPSTWHVVPEIGLINPCFTAPGEVRWAASKPVVLRYRVMAFDGVPELGLVNRMAESWYQGQGG